ncbi:MAG: hypothetical protein QNJ41_19205 [Xenococcaceae cyanobacterium MO_188.B32]|nr:hypothetical protein [Xenococcaceae cyanobacterium MO_188.B32]
MTEITQEEMRQRLGNVSQLRDLLLGDKIEEYEGSFAQNSQRLDTLESSLMKFQSEVNERLNKMQDSLSKEINAAVDSLEKKIKYLSLTTHEENNKLKQEIEAKYRTTSQSIDTLQNSLRAETSYLKEELFQTRDTLGEDLQNLKQQVLEKLESNFSELTETKVSRTDLAEVLFELCLKVKGSDFVPSLKDASENTVKAEFILPEENTESNHHS